MLQREDAGYGNGQEPSGHIRIESWGNKGKLSAVVQNLKESENRFTYKLYIMKQDERQCLPAFAGILKTLRGRGELQWEFDPSNVAGTGCKIDDFNMAAVIVEYRDRGDETIICPVACKEKRAGWREKLKEALYPAAGREYKEPDIFSIYDNKLLSKYQPDSTKAKGKESEAEKNKTEQISEKLEISAMEQIPVGGEPPEYGKINENYESPEKDESPEWGAIAGKNEIAAKPVKAADETGVGCIMKDNAPCTEQSEQGNINACLNCYARNVKADAEGEEPDGFNMERLKTSLGKYFKEYDPFGSRRRDYKWWKVNSPAYLNNILYQCNVRTPLLFNPKVMMAHFKYRHLIVGVYSDRLRRRECIVCGVPGAYNIDDNPFGESARWVQLEGNRPKYGAFGYWLIYMDPKTGKTINLS